MEEMYDGLHNYADKALMSPDNLNMMMMIPSDNYVYHGLNIASAATDHQPPFPIFGSDDYMSAAAAGSGSCLNQSFSVISSETASINPEIQKRDYEHEEEEDQENACRVIKSKIASHPSYPKLIDAYLDCQKVGAPPEIGCFLDEMRRENGVIRRDSVSSTCLGADPELDYFMETYCDILVKYKSDLSKTFDEAKSFLNNIQFQLGSLSGDNGGGVSSEDDFSGGETEAQDAQMMKGEEDIELKERLFRKYGNHISTLKQEFSKKKKKGKLPKEATKILLEWWNVHYKWPYPTEADKISLAESTRLDQKQINNWFINQRKRHWKPSENMQLAVVDNLSGQFFADD